MPRGRPNLPVDAITAAQGRAYVLSMLGYPVAEIAKMEGVTERAVYDRIAKGREIIRIDSHLVAGVQRIYALIGPAIDRLEDIVKNGSDRDAHAAARTILDAARLTKVKNVRELPWRDESDDDSPETIEEQEERIRGVWTRLNHYFQKKSGEKANLLVETEVEVIEEPDEPAGPKSPHEGPQVPESR